MKKEVLEEINRFRELVSLKPITVINENVTDSVLSEQFAALKKVGLESIEKEMMAFMKSEAKELAIQELKKGAITSYRAGLGGAKKISAETVEKVMQQIELKGGRALNAGEKKILNRQIRDIMAKEIKNSINQTAKEYAEQITKQSTRSGTWEAIKKHFGKHWKKYAAAGLLAAIFAYFYPGETPPPDPTEPVPDPDEDRIYRYCPDFPFTKFCKNDKIREIQKCIGAEVDGAYGPETERKLKENGYSTTITKEVFDEILEKCKGGRKNEPEPEPEPENTQIQQGTEFLDDNVY